MNKTTSILSSLIIVGLFSISSAAESNAAEKTIESHYRIANKFHVEGDLGWDALAVDASSGRVFLSHGDKVQVIEAQSGKLLGTIPDTKGVHAIALATDLNKGFISDGKDSAVTVFDLNTLATLARIRVTGQNPDLILNISHRIFVFNGKSNNATVIDAKTDSVIATIPLPGKPEFAAADGNRTVYLNIEDKSLLVAIDVIDLKVTHQWPIAPGEEPSGLAIDRDNNRLFVGCSNKTLVVFDPGKGQVVTTLPIGERVDGVAFDAKLKRAYSSNGEGTLTVIQEVNKNEFKVLETVQTQLGARTLALDAKTHHLYLPTAEFGAAPAPTAEKPKPRPAILPNTFVLLDVEPLN